MLFLKNLLFTILVPGTVAGYLPYLYFRRQPGPPWLGGVPSFILFGIAATVYGWCVWDFAVFGRGTPAPIDAPKRLVVRGLYRYSRNPMYLGVLCGVLGWVLLRPGVSLTAYFIGVATVFELVVLWYEEPTLRRSCGEQYELYCRQVSRWIGGSPGRRLDA